MTLFTKDSVTVELIGMYPKPKKRTLNNEVDIFLLTHTIFRATKAYHFVARQ